MWVYMKIKIQFSFLLFSLLFINSAYAIDQDDELFDQVDMQLEQQRAKAAMTATRRQKATMKQYEAKMKAANAYNEALQSGFVPGSTTGGFEDSKEAQSQKVFGGGPMGAIDKTSAAAVEMLVVKLNKVGQPFRNQDQTRRFL